MIDAQDKNKDRKSRGREDGKMWAQEEEDNVKLEQLEGEWLLLALLLSFYIYSWEWETEAAWGRTGQKHRRVAQDLRQSVEWQKNLQDLLQRWGRVKENAQYMYK